MEATKGSRKGFHNFCEVLAVRHGLTDYNAERRLQVGDYIIALPKQKQGRKMLLNAGHRQTSALL